MKNINRNIIITGSEGQIGKDLIKKIINKKFTVILLDKKKKKHKIIFSGYHGWHDWYISANLSNSKNLNNHLLRNLKPLGVPSTLKNSIIPLRFNDHRQLVKLFNKNKDANILVIEGARNDYPSKK